MDAIEGNRTTVCETKKFLGFIPTGQKCTTTGTTRMDIVRHAVLKFIHEVKDVNLSMMSFNANFSTRKECVKKVLGICLEKRTITTWRSHGGRVDVASQNISTALSPAQSALNRYFPNGFTPLSESLYETRRYFGGHPLYFGRVISTNPDILISSHGSVWESRDGSYYKSPIVDQCQKNSVVIFTDGDPSDDSDANGTIRSFIRGKRLPAGLSINCGGNGGCLDELAWYLHNYDIRPDMPGKQTLRTFTVGGFGARSQLLIDTARFGGGRYYDAGDVERLAEVLKDSLARVNADDSTLAPPATSVSAVNSLETAEDVYYTVFKPGRGASWTGNLKRYRLGRDNKLYDRDGRPAIDPDTGFFADNTRSYWSSWLDGKDVGSGGMARMLSPDRPVFTNISGDTRVNLRAANNRLHENNTSIKPAALNIASPQGDFFGQFFATVEAKETLRWARGIDVDDEDRDGEHSDDRNSIGDPIHTQPQVVTYFKNSSGSTVDKTVFFTTNDGFLHAVNADNGSTEFSFIPRDLLGNLKQYREAYDNVNPGRKIYGMDGPMTVWIRDSNGDGDVLSSNNGRADSGDHVYLYLTMRRGGNNIYALNVTDRNNPVLKWVIRGDVDNNRLADWYGDFGRMGQTWSAPKLVQVKWKGRLRHVLLFGGGYDAAIDGHTTIQNSNIGFALFMVDAENGEILWRASYENSSLNIPSMLYSIPASPTPLDLNRDGAVDVIFVGDTGGQIFRIDINQNNTGASNFATGGVIAKLSGSSAADARRFFEPVAVSLGRENRYLNIAVGSGFRPSPLSTSVNDRMYVIKDPHVTGKPSNYGYVNGRPITEANLYDATSNLLQQGNSSQRSSALSSLNSASGWYMKLEEDGEKVLGKPVIYNGALLFSSFIPMFNDRGSCLPMPGINYMYAVNIDNGAAVSNLRSGGSTLNKDDRSIYIKSPTVAPSPTVISRGTEGSNVCVGTTCLQNKLNEMGKLPVYRRYWRENR